VTLPSAAELRALLVVATLTLVPFVGLAIWAAQGVQAAWEQGLLNMLLAPPGLAGAFSNAVNAVGNLPVWSVVIAAAAGAMLVLRGARAAALVALSFASDLAAFGVKVLVERERPDTAAVHQFFGADNFSFPSGHTVRAAALVAVVVWLLAPVRLRVPLAVVGGALAGLVMGYARVSLGVHWPTDTIGGTLLGISWFALTTIVVFGSIKPRPEVNGPQG
jgi:undecaprenyl-diphosphatase